VAVVEADLAGFWVGRAFPTAVPRSVVVATTPLPGFAAAGALMARLAGRPSIGVRAGGMEVDGGELEPEVLALAQRLGVGVVVQAWAPDAPAMSADEHARATEADYRGVGAPSQGSSSQGSLVRPVAVALDDLDAIVEVAGRPVSWATLPSAPSPSPQ
jgi:hypothetical protein